MNSFINIDTKSPSLYINAYNIKCQPVEPFFDWNTIWIVMFLDLTDEHVQIFIDDICLALENRIAKCVG